MVTGAVPVELPGVVSVHNPDWMSGMGSSLAAGLRALAGGAAAAVIALADQPLVGAAAVRRLIAAHASGAAVAVAAYDGQPRNPVLIDRAYWPAVIETATGDAGARTFLRAHPDLVTLVECGDTGSPDDIDTPEDLARVREPAAGSGLTPRRTSPQRTVTDSLGCKTIRSSPLANAFGGHVIGSTATAARRRSSSSGSLVKTCSQGLAASIHMAVVSPPPGEPDPGEAVRLPAQAGKGVVELHAGQLAGGPQVEAGPGHVLRGAGRDEPVIDGLPAVGGQLELALVDRPGARRQVRVRPRAPGCRAAALVGRGHGDVQPGLGVDAGR